MKNIIQMVFKLRKPLAYTTIQKQLSKASVHNKHVSIFTRFYGAKSRQYKGMNVYEINHHSHVNRQILFLHGGAYIHGLNLLHFRFCAQLARKTGCKVTLVDYPLLPDATSSEAYDLITKYYKLKCKDNTILIGDSAGGGLALGLLHHLKALGLALPIRTVLSSPWLDLTMENPEIQAYKDKDFILDYEGLKLLGDLWSGESDIRDVLNSPINGSNQNLDNLLLIGGSDELFTPDIRLLGQIIQGQNNCEYLEIDGMFHDFALFSDMGLREADIAFRRILDFLL